MNRSGYPDGCNQAVHDREMAETDGNENAVMAEMEQRAEDAVADLSPDFREWLAEQPDLYLRLTRAACRRYTKEAPEHRTAIREAAVARAAATIRRDYLDSVVERAIESGEFGALSARLA